MKYFLLVFALFHMLNICITEGQLKIGFYSQTCPNAGSIVKSVVKEATIEDPIIPPLLLRLHFHDCFVEGCDGSILIEKGENNADEHQGVGGFDEINKAKEKLEAECPGVVSCADIVAMAARDAVALTGGPIYEVETGRRDGRISSESLAKDMPDVNDSIETLKSKFRNKGFSEKELVLLSGDEIVTDPKINPKLLSEIKNFCPQNRNLDNRLPLDSVTGDKFDDQSLRNIKSGFAVLASDARLYDDDITREVVDSYIGDSSFAQDFATAMVKMGRVGVKIGSDGEIRRVEKDSGFYILISCFVICSIR
ncbi:hypothetical protein DH2020_007260 [Rehmannia glutinosa]|uniref:Peroxidase n=1 Tax=Rehmannia glutinosa TaxID=99300 RepID=A0ABR0TY54_REHGL